jgi:ferric-dicitrate binding protein FerR (iron transport regulator)
MNQEIIERLVIDKASGELTPDAAALLDDWLRREPGAKAEAAEIEETLALAKRALIHEEEKAILRPKFRRPAWLPWAAGMAACFVAGLALGLLALRQPTLKPPVENLAAAPDAGFWSARRLQMTSPAAKVQGPRLIWKSPIRKPQLEASF